MAQFSAFSIATDNETFSFLPYDRGASGAFVYREGAATVYAPRVVISTSVNDNASDKYTVQSNTPRTCPVVEGCLPDQLLGTDLVKTEVRFLAHTNQAERKVQLDKHIETLLEFRSMMETRDVIYS